MKLTVRRVGNSLGVILPKATLDAWNVGEGDSLELNDHGIRPAARGGLSHVALDALKRRIAGVIVGRFSAREIRAQILANLHRWKKQGTWGAAYVEWLAIAESGDDGELYAAMLGRNDEGDRLRQSMPFVGLLTPAELREINEEAGG
jgi:antitoxin component of MazEF toxin-antitoxin module